MDRALNEIAAVEKTVSDVAEAQAEQLSELQLALVGGGIAEVVF